jgi:hypothetical protein
VGGAIGMDICIPLVPRFIPYMAIVVGGTITTKRHTRKGKSGIFHIFVLLFISNL